MSRPSKGGGQFICGLDKLGSDGMNKVIDLG